jgi:hypothetical protein
MKPRAPLGLVLALLADPVRTTEYVVAGGDFTSVQAGLDAAGDTVTVRQKPTPAFEKIAFPRSGQRGSPPRAPLIRADVVDKDAPLP